MIQLSENINTLGSTFSSVDYDIYNKFELANDKDVFEKVIDDLMVERYTKDPEIKEYIKSLSKGNKRVAILSLLGEDNLLWSKINDILKEKKTGYQRLKEVYFLLRDYVKIADVERKKHGEILTPFKELAEPMVKLVEKYDSEFWKNPNHKVLDSSAGYGTFLILSAYKFMVGLKDWEPDEEKRFKWIVENCLYYGELQARSVFSWLVAIDPYDEYKTNTYYGSFLVDDFDKHTKNVWGITKWNLIIQNPPYQIQKDGFKETQSLWNHFVKKSLGLVITNGYMVMVHPSGWRNVSGAFENLQKEMIHNQILELNINDEQMGQRIFGATTGFDFYIMKKIDRYKNTVIMSKEGESTFDLSQFGFIPSSKFDDFMSILAKDGEERVSIIHDYTYERRKKIMSRSVDDQFKYPCVYTISKNGNIQLYYSSIKDGHFGISKVIWSNGKASTPICDYEGVYGMTGFAYAIVDDKSNLDGIRKAMCDDRFISIMKCCDINDGNRFNKRVMSLLKKDFWKEFI